MRIGSITFAAIVLLISLAVGRAWALDSIHGTWSIEPGRDAAHVHLTLQTSDDASHSHDTSSFDIGSDQLGIGSALSGATSSEVKLTILREAGSIVCTGTVGHGTGSGTYVFMPSDAFRSRMHDRGYDDLELHTQFAAAALDLTTGFIDRIGAAGYPHLSFERLIAFRALGIDEDFVRDMRSTFAGTEISAAQLLSLRALSVTREYVAQMRDGGFAVDDPNDAVQLRALDVSGAYVRDLASAGYDHLSSRELVQLRALGIDAAYIKRVEAHGFSHLPIDKLIQLKALNVIY
jgi:hypothetical protein